MTLPHKSLLFNILLQLFVVVLKIVPSIECGAITNKMRYATNKEKATSSVSLEQAFELAASTARSNFYQPSPKENSYTINSRDKQPGKINYKSLDEEDKRLLNKFYSEAKRSDPFMFTESLWDDPEVGGFKALLDDNPNLLHTNGYGDRSQASGTQSTGGLEPEFVNGHNDKSVPSPTTLIDSGNQARYSPTLRLLTSYDPVATTHMKNSIKKNIYLAPKNNRIVGATVYGQDRNSKPDVSSKSALEAVKLHDDLMKKPPNDGKVRVRMYYHQAIHDDSRLYGTGPWKYWGHGWGLEFGYDPRSETKNKDFYQKGYTIERAFGRDFCIDKSNCRQPDPNFFKDPHNVGHYSKQHAARLKRPTLRPKGSSVSISVHENAIAK